MSLIGLNLDEAQAAVREWLHARTVKLEDVWKRVIQGNPESYPWSWFCLDDWEERGRSIKRKETT